MTDRTIRARPTRDAPPRMQSYAQERARFPLEVPERFNPVLAIVDSWAEEDPDAPAVLSLDAHRRDRRRPVGRRARPRVPDDRPRAAGRRDRQGTTACS